MIHAIYVRVVTALKAKGFPSPVLMGPENDDPAVITAARERVIFEYSKSTESPRAAAKVQANPVSVAAIDQPFTVSIYAKSPRAGAKDFEHKERALRMRDMVVVALDGAIRGGIKTRWKWSGQLVTPEDVKGTKSEVGALYVMTCTVARSIDDLDWKGDAQPEAELENVNTVTKAGTEIACGGP